MTGDGHADVADGMDADQLGPVDWVFDGRGGEGGGDSARGQ